MKVWRQVPHDIMFRTTGVASFISLDRAPRSGTNTLLASADSGDGGVPDRLVSLLDAAWNARSAGHDPASTMEVAP